MPYDPPSFFAKQWNHSIKSRSTPQFGFMGQALTNLAEQASSEYIKAQKLLSDKAAELEKEFQVKKEKIDLDFIEKNKILEEKYKQKEATLEKSKKDLDDRSNKLDDRDHTHVRRQIRNDLKAHIAELAKDFHLTKGTQKLRTPIFFIALFALLLIGALFVWHSYIAFGLKYDSMSSIDIVMLAAKTTTLTLGFLAVLAWYLRWMNSWFERHAEAEFQLKQFELDMERASWVVETALEWRQTQESAMPEHLIESISRNLFVKSEKDEVPDITPAEYLASTILGRSASAKIAFPGGEVELDRKALQNKKKPSGNSRNNS